MGCVTLRNIILHLMKYNVYNTFWNNGTNSQLFTVSAMSHSSNISKQKKAITTIMSTHPNNNWYICRISHQLILSVHLSQYVDTENCFIHNPAILIVSPHISNCLFSFPKPFLSKTCFIKRYLPHIHNKKKKIRKVPFHCGHFSSSSLIIN